jgi:hypothetical protein
METSEGRSPRPQGGDPNVKTMRLTLAPDEWRKLRAWAAEDGTNTQAVVAAIVRRALARKSRRTFGQDLP